MITDHVERPELKPLPTIEQMLELIEGSVNPCQPDEIAVSTLDWNRLRRLALIRKDETGARLFGTMRVTRWNTLAPGQIVELLEGRIVRTHNDPPVRKSRLATVFAPLY